MVIFVEKFIHIQKPHFQIYTKQYGILELSFLLLNYNNETF